MAENGGLDSQTSRYAATLREVRPWREFALQRAAFRPGIDLQPPGPEYEKEPCERAGRENPILQGSFEAAAQGDLAERIALGHMHPGGAADVFIEGQIAA